MQAAAMTGAQLERAMEALENAPVSEFRRLDQDARGWMRLFFTALSHLGLTPLAMSRLGLNLALGRSAAIRAVHEHITET